MHPLHVIHRDVKPENVLYRRLISGELHFLLTDFGIAKLRADDSARTRTGQSLMTYEYAAPEQFDNPRQVDEAADYYALGAVLYECITGHVPFVLHHENGLGGFMNQVLTAPIPTPVLPNGQALPPSLGTLLMALLTRNPANRLRNPDQLELLLEQGRVEHLKASRAAQPVPNSYNQTVAGPVAATVYNEQPYEEADVPDEETGISSGTWWGIGGIVAALGLAAGLYMYSDRETPANSANQIDSTMLMQPSTTPIYSDSIETTPIDDEPAAETATEQETGKPVPADTSARQLPVIDSDTTMVPDTTE